MPGVESNIGVDIPATIDQRLDARRVTQPVSGNAVDRELVVLADPVGVDATARVLSADPAAADLGLVIRSIRGFAAATPEFTDLIDRALRDAGKIDIAGFDVALPAGANEIGGARARGQLDDVGTVVPTEDGFESVRITPQRAAHANLRNAAGTEIGTAAAPVRTDPTGTTTQPVDSELPTAAALSENMANPTAPAVGAFGMVFDGTTWDRLPGTSAEGADVDVTRTPKSSTVTAHAQTAVGIVGVQLLAANASRKQVMVQNTGTTVIKLSLTDTDPTQTSYHIALKAGSAADDGLGGVFVSDLWQGIVRAISSAAGGTVVVTEIT